VGVRGNGPVGAEELVRRARELWEDPSYSAARAWKEAAPDRKVAGYFPVYVPLELFHAHGILPVGIFGAGAAIEIDHANSRVQSFVCSICRSSLELGLTERLRFLDAMVFSNICDVARNLSGIFRRNFPDLAVVYLHYPQNPASAAALDFYRSELERLDRALEAVSGRAVGRDDLSRSIRLHNENRRLVQELYRLRRERPEAIETSELYSLLRAGLVLPVEDHTSLLGAALEAARSRERRPRDMVRVVLEGSFCEQPPLELLQILEQTGCHVVDDDLILHERWFRRAVDEDTDPFLALARAYLDRAVESSVRYHGPRSRGFLLVEKVRRHGADGVVFCTAKFCEPALLDYARTKEALEREKIPYLAIEFEEKMGVFESVRTQLETFVESILFFAEGAEALPARGDPR
jgi:benzoyl-CoA reductase subunit C